MDNNNNGNKGFSFTYSAEEQDELRRIREKYLTENEAEDKMARLRRLDASVSAKAQTVAIIIGVVGILILGFGMSLCMTDLGEVFGFQSNMSMIVGIAVGIIGVIFNAFFVSSRPIPPHFVQNRRKNYCRNYGRTA